MHGPECRVIGATDGDIRGSCGEKIHEGDLVKSVRATQTYRCREDKEIVFGERQIVNCLAHVASI